MQSIRSISNASFQRDCSSPDNTPRSSKDHSENIQEPPGSPNSPNTSDLELRSQDENFAPNGDLSPSPSFNLQSNSSSSNIAVVIPPAEVYNPYKPANIEEAEAHGVMSIQLAQEVRKLDPNSVLNPQAKICPCCMMPINAPKFRLNCNVDELAQLGPYFSMYFYYIRYVALMLLIFFIFVGLPCLIGNISQDGLSEEYKIARTTIVNYVEEVKEEFTSNIYTGTMEVEVPLYQVVIHIVADVFLLAFYMFFLVKMRSHCAEINLGNSEPSDFTIWVSNLPEKYDIEDLKLYFENHGRFDGKYAEVVSVIPIYDISDMHKVHRRISNLRCEEIGKSANYVRKINQLESKLKKLQEGVLDKKTDKALITFRYRTDAMRILEDCYRDEFMYLLYAILCKSDNKIYRDKTIKVKPSPDPTDILWENMNISGCYAFITHLIKVIISGILIYLSYNIAMIYLNIKYMKDFYNLHYYIYLIFTFIIIVINFLLEKLILISSKYYLYRFDRYKTRSDWYISITYLLGISIALNTSLVPSTTLGTYDWYYYTLHADTIFNILILNAIVSPILYIINPRYQLQKCKRWGTIQHNKNSGPAICQSKANDMFEGPKIDIAARNLHLIKTYLIVMLYSPLLPIGILIGAITFIIDYWATKFMLLRIYSRPTKYGVRIYDNLVPWILWGICSHAVRYIQAGVIIFLNFDSIYYIICILLFLIIPIRRIVKRIYKKSTADILDKLYDGDSKENDYYKQLPYFHTVRYM